MFTFETVAVIGFLLGPIGRTLYDFFWKIVEDPDCPFSKVYWVSMAASLGISLFVGLVELPLYIASIPEGSYWFIFATSFAQGFMLNHLINKPIAHSLKERKDHE